MTAAQDGMGATMLASAGFKRKTTMAVVMSLLMCLYLMSGCGQEQGTETVENTAVQTPRAPDLSDQVDHFVVNRLISSFTQAGGYYLGEEFDRDTALADQWAAIAITKYLYCGGSWESCFEQFDGLTYNIRFDAETLDQITQYLSGVTIDWSELDFFHYNDGYVYAEITNGWGRDGPAVATETHDNGDGTMVVSYVAYATQQVPANHITSKTTWPGFVDESLYVETIDGLNKLMDMEGPNIHGTAVIAYEPFEYGWDLELVSMTYARDDGEPIRSLVSDRENRDDS